ncbi:RsbT co-antagonist protein RsbRB [Salipaludibacillus keqinensis]|uniref:RsbT co-antagonist protein RsbRB n=1 Tax=Salipaludibacillus keqinensis TaxID=2045207 RepID=A0A323TKP2_9BACI|nr:STAS domain-containing protein [Salipaludibacillus keqinensis]PYZ94676.1 RsbT co-antagonist protein RsbRB [Salipaludibacillus keqinensis]
MYKSKELYDYLISNVNQITEEWYETIDKKGPKGIYSSQDPSVVNNLKRQNNEFHKRFFEVFNQEESIFFQGLEKWILEIAMDDEHLNTPLHLILREFNRTQQQYVKLIDEYVETVKEEYPLKEIIQWYRTVDKTFREITVWFVEEHTNFSKKRIEAQQEVIMELSSPVITLSQHVALLPLVGEIDSSRSKIILENTMEQCSQLGVNYLLLDLSGVVKIDQIVAAQLMHLIDALKLIGVSTTLSGLRPELAHSTVKLGLNLDHVTIKPSLADSIRSREFALK